MYDSYVTLCDKSLNRGTVDDRSVQCTEDEKTPCLTREVSKRLLKATRAQFGYTLGNYLKCHKSINNCMIKHKRSYHLLVLKTIVHKRTFSNTPFNTREIIFLSTGQKGVT